MTLVDNQRIIDIFVDLSSKDFVEYLNKEHEVFKIEAHDGRFTYGCHRNRSQKYIISYCEDRAEQRFGNLFSAGVRFFSKSDFLRAGGRALAHLGDMSSPCASFI